MPKPQRIISSDDLPKVSAAHRLHRTRFKPLLMLSIVLILLAIVGLCVEIPIVSDYAFWVMAANYLLVVAGTGSNYLVVFSTS